MSNPDPLALSTVRLKRNPENGWIDLVLRAPDPAEAERRLDEEAEALRRQLGQDLTLHEALEIQRLTAELDSLRTDLRRTQQLRCRPPDIPPAAESDPPAPPDEPAPPEEAPHSDFPSAEGLSGQRPRDIVFLGRGVSGRLNDRRCDLARLLEAGLPVLATPADAASVLGLSLPRLRWLAYHTEVATRVHYVHFTVPKKSGGTRSLSAPHKLLAGAQRWVLDNILAKLPVERACHGFLPGRSIVSNAAVHAGQGVVVNLDLQGFFPSIGFPRVRRAFERLGYSPAVATVLALLCTECPRRLVRYAGTLYWVATGPRGLPQGACTSPALSNQVARRLDRRLQGLAKRLEVRYTRYADDLTFSGSAELPPRLGYLLARVRRIAEEEGFALNDKKTRVLRRHRAQVVTGLVVNERPGVSRKEVRRLRAILHRARHEGLEAQNREGRPNFRAWLLGKIAYVKMARAEVGARLLAEFRALAGGASEKKEGT
jgi:retron-type reverse transcriptase